MIHDSDGERPMQTVVALLAGVEPRRLAETDVAGLRVSTIVSLDLGPETAIVDADGAHPVERYATEEDALLGHEHWVARLRAGVREVTHLGYGQMIMPRAVRLMGVDS